MSELISKIAEFWKSWADTISIPLVDLRNCSENQLVEAGKELNLYIQVVDKRWIQLFNFAEGTRVTFPVVIVVRSFQTSTACLMAW